MKGEETLRLVAGKLIVGYRPGSKVPLSIRLNTSDSIYGRPMGVVTTMDDAVKLLRFLSERLTLDALGGV
jgi:hypothetical protein